MNNSIKYCPIAAVAFEISFRAFNYYPAALAYLFTIANVFLCMLICSRKNFWLSVLFSLCFLFWWSGCLISSAGDDIILCLSDVLFLEIAVISCSWLQKYKWLFQICFFFLPIAWSWCSYWLTTSDYCEFCQSVTPLPLD